MNAISQRIRPKHQVLVLKCYPRTTKGAVDVKPNSSELSYLLFYATSRRSKIQKVGQFLEKKTASDVWRLRIGNVQVTLQILAALIEKSPKDLPLFAQNVLKILGTVLGSNDITMVEASLSCFATFCENHDVSSLLADQAYLHQYEDIVRTYATFASTRHVPPKISPSKPVIMRWRSAGLEAIKSVADSDSLGSVAGRQLNVIVPMILENLWTDNDDFIQALLRRAQFSENVDNDRPLSRRRTSISTAKTSGDTNPIAFSGTTNDMDKLAEEDVGVLALQCLKQIFMVPNRAQIFGGTKALVQFVKERVLEKEAVVKQDKNGRDSGWAITMFDLVTRWAPVQDRYVILVTTIDALVKTPQGDDNMTEQITLAAIIASLLRSDINLIGLSIMDVLLSLLQCMKRTLKAHGGSPTNGTTSPESKSNGSEQPSTQQKDLLHRVQQCIGDLATHVYYADQISDMISAILGRLKPHPNAANALLSTEKSDVTVAPEHSTGNISEDQRTLDSLFALESAKVTALKAIKSILLVANPKTKMSDNIGLTRNKVPIQVWEGTQWLLSDPDGHVRKAYADALATWLDRETTKADLRARDESLQKLSRGSKDISPAAIARRAVSSASARDKHTRVPRSQFLPMLHLAIYDNALQYIEYETDMVVLHVLLVKLVMKLGVNAARYGLPMVFRLQEDIQDAESPLSKVRLGCLCHGYFWAISEHFDLGHSVVGRAIQNEIERRRSKHFWVEGINFPPPPLELAGTPGMLRPQPKMPIHEIESEALLPFDERLPLVDEVCANYNQSPASPPASPPTSPSRAFNQPILGSTLSAIPQATSGQELPLKFKDDMLTEWTRESAVAALQTGSRAASLDGSKTANTTAKGSRLGVNGHSNGGSRSQSASPYHNPNNLRPHSHVGTSHGGAVSALRKQSQGSVHSGSSRGFVASVDQLKSVLSGENTRPISFRAPDEDDNDSMVSYDFTVSELSIAQEAGEDGSPTSAGLTRTRSKSRERKASGDEGGPLTSHPLEATDEEELVPPVPPLPSGMAASPTSPVAARPPSAKDYAPRASQRSIKSRAGTDSILSSSMIEADPLGGDLQSMLKGIDSKSRENTVGNLTKPPY